MTDFSNKCEILAELWMDYRDDEEFQDFIEYNDLGLPLAYAFQGSLIKNLNPSGEALIDETWTLFLAGLEIEDTGFETLDDVFGSGLL